MPDTAPSKDTWAGTDSEGQHLTAQQAADKQAGYGGQPHPSAAASPPAKQPGPSIHPTAKNVYGAPISAPILK